MTLEGLRAALADQGLAFSKSTLWRFFDRRGITHEENDSAGEASKSAPMS